MMTYVTVVQIFILCVTSALLAPSLSTILATLVTYQPIHII